jgi:hypothetical protein
MGYAFQIYAVFVACSDTLKDNYKLLTDSILGKKDNWEADMKYLIPALSNFVVAMIFRHPDFIKSYSSNLSEIT